MSAEEWKFINTFAPWFSAIGTLIAVAVSLYIAHSTRKISLVISSGIYDFNENGIDKKYLAIYVTNIGYSTVFLNNATCVSLRVGRFKKTNIGIGWKFIDTSKSSIFPCKLGQNETACLFLKIESDGDNWLRNFRDKYLKIARLSTLRIVVYPNVGKPFKAKPDKTVIREFQSIC